MDRYKLIPFLSWTIHEPKVQTKHMIITRTNKQTVKQLLVRKWHFFFLFILHPFIYFQNGKFVSKLIQLFHFLTFFIFYLFYKWEYPDLFQYLIILLSICNPSIPHISGYYKEKSLDGGPKILIRGFESIS